MKNKIALLLIIISLLGALSVYLVYKNKDSSVGSDFDYDLIKDSQAAYLKSITETNYLPLRDWAILEPDVKAKAAVVYDQASEKILFQKNLKTQLPIASITKLATAMIVVENINPEAEILITIDSMNVDEVGGEDFPLNQEFKARELLKAMLIESSNDAAYAFKVYLKERGFDMVELMNRKALDIGMEDTHFKDPAGLSDGGYSTAKDIIELVEASKKYPEIVENLNLKSAKITSVDGTYSREMKTTNELLGILPGIELGKTGYTDGALGTMAVSISLSGANSSLIGVVLGSYDRFGEISSIINWARRAHQW